MSNHVAASGGDAIGMEFNRHLHTNPLNQPFPNLLRHINGRNIEIAVFDEGKWIYRACHLLIP